MKGKRGRPRKYNTEEERLAAIRAAKRSYKNKNKERYNKKDAEYYQLNKDKLKAKRLAKQLVVSN